MIRVFGPVNRQYQNDESESPVMTEPIEKQTTVLEKRYSETAAKAGIGFGCVLAIVLSWTANKSIGRAIIHGILSWFYVIYYLLTNEDWTLL